MKWRQSQTLEPNRIERGVQIGAGALGLIVAGLVSYRVGAGSGVEVGVATFVLSWTLVAAFVLLARLVTQRLLSESSVDTPPEGASAVEPASPTATGRSRRRRKRRCR
jgi:hypothetical protein